MSRSGYSEDGDYAGASLWENVVNRSIKGKRGQAFLRELVTALDAMPNKRLIAAELITETGEVCAIGAVCKARGLDVSHVDADCRYDVGKLVGIAPTMAAEIEYQNDEVRCSNTPEQRWERMRKWAVDKLDSPSQPKPGGE